MTSRSTGDLKKIYRYSEDISKSRGRILVMLNNEQSRGTMVDKRRTNRIENLRVRLNRLTLRRHDEIVRVYSNAVVNRDISPAPRRRRRHRSARPTKPRRSSKSPRPRPITAPVKNPPISSLRSRSVTSARSSSRSSEPVVTPRDQSVSPSPPSPRPVSPIIPMKVTHIVIEPTKTIVDMVPTSLESDQENDEVDDDAATTDDSGEENDDNIYPEGIIDFRPYKTVARFRKLIGRSTDFRLNPLIVGENSTETLVLGLESFAQAHGCDLSFTSEDQRFDKSIYRAACGTVDLGAIHLLATDSLLTANFQFEISLDYDNDITQSKENIEKFVIDFCDAISKVLSCANNNVRVFSIDKLAKQSGRSQINFGLTTSDSNTTKQLAHDLQTHARSGFATDTILQYVKRGEYEGTWKPVLTHLKIQRNDLDDHYNQDYRTPGWPEKETRGNCPYYFPRGWYRHGLNVLDKYGDDHTWIGRVDAKGEWPVAYHGTKKEAVSGIVKQGLLPSAVVRDAMLHEAIDQMGDGANRPGLYVATHCDGGSYPQYTTPFTVTTFPDKSERFSIVFQCRAQPDKFTTHTSPVSKGEAWRFVDPNAIRPYGILLKKEA